MSFKNKVLLPVITVFVLTVFMIAANGYRLLDISVRATTNSLLDLFTSDMLLKINQLEIILEEVKGTLNEKHMVIGKAVARSLDHEDADMSRDALRVLCEPLGIATLSVADAEGTIIHSNFDEYIGFNYASAGITQKYLALADGSLAKLWEEPRRSVIQIPTGVDLCQYIGIARKGGGFYKIGFDAGVLLRLEGEINIGRIIEDTKLDENGFGIVLFDGKINAHPDAEWLGYDVSSEDWYQSIKKGDGFTWININGIDYYAGHKNTDTGYTIVGLIPRNEYYKEINEAFLETVLVVVIASILLAVITYVIVGIQLKPIKQVTEGLGKIAKGNFDAKIEGNCTNEFALIRNAVHDMAADIKAHISMISGIEYASKIQKNMLPMDSAMANAFSDYSVIWEPRDVVGGDIYWLKQFDQGTVLVVCDCTGHGTSGALLTMLVVSALESMVWPSNCKDTAQAAWQIEQRLVDVFNVREHDCGNTIKDGCDLAILFIANDGNVHFSAGNMSVFVCDGTEVRRIKGQKIFLGEGNLQSKDEIETFHVPSDAANKFYIASDGLFDQPGGKQGMPFGYGRFKKIILENHREKQSVISGRVWESFETYRGAEPRVDDFELITFKP